MFRQVWDLTTALSMLKSSVGTSGWTGGGGGCGGPVAPAAAGDSSGLDMGESFTHGSLLHSRQ